MTEQYWKLTPPGTRDDGVRDKMIIQFDLTPQERFLVYVALTAAEERLKDEAGYRELMQRVSALPCGAPGCSYCDPED